MSSLSLFYDANLRLLSNLKCISGEISNTELCSCPPPFTSSAGAHLRHITDHHKRFLEDIETGLIRYDLRYRRREVEQDIICLESEISELMAQLQMVADKVTLNRLIDVSMSVHESAPAATVSSSIARELMFLQSHGIHHLAQVKTILALQGIDIADEDCIASSTVKHLKNLAVGTTTASLKHCA